MTAPSIKEALEIVENLIRRDPACFNLSDELLPVRSTLRALATFQPDGERREAIAREPFAWAYRSIFNEHSWTLLKAEPHFDNDQYIKKPLYLASGLVQNEAGILKAMEQECWTLRCVDIPTGGGDADVGWEVIQHHQAKPYERMIAHGRTPQEALTAAIRSARNGGAS